MRFEKPNAEQLAWRESVRRNGSIISGLSNVEIHHVIGRTAKVKDVGNLGHWFILGLDRQEHEWIGWGNEGLRLLKKACLDPDECFLDLSMMEFQKLLFAMTYERLRPNFPDGVYEAIMKWHR